MQIVVNIVSSYFLARDDAGFFGTKGLSSSIFIVMNVLDSIYCYKNQKKMYNHCMCTTSTVKIKVFVFWRYFYHLPFCVCDFAFWCCFCFECWHRWLGKIVGVKQIDMSPDITMLYNAHYFLSFHCTPYHNTSHHIPQRTIP